MNDGVIVLAIGLAAATLRVATPLLLATLGELIAERAGVLFLGIEGTMMVGAFTGFAVAYASGSLLLGLLAALVAGALAGLLMALLAVYLGLNQHVSGLGITLLGTGLSLYFFRLWFGSMKVQPKIVPMHQWTPPGWLGPFVPLFEQYALTYGALLLVPVLWWVLQRTRFGLRLRSVGESPEAVDVAGLNVYRLRTLALMLGGALMAVGGAFLTLAQLGSFTFGITAGRGWVAIALVIFGNWKPGRVLLGALLFGFVQALALHIQAVGANLPYQALLALPYLITILALVLARRGVQAPAALLRPYRREG